MISDRLEEIRERRAAQLTCDVCRKHAETQPSDIDYLLALIDSPPVPGDAARRAAEEIAGEFVVKQTIAELTAIISRHFPAAAPPAAPIEAALTPEEEEDVDFVFHTVTVAQQAGGAEGCRVATDTICDYIATIRQTTLANNAPASDRWATVTKYCGYCGHGVRHLCTAFLKTDAAPTPEAAPAPVVPCDACGYVKDDAVGAAMSYKEGCDELAIWRHSKFVATERAPVVPEGDAEHIADDILYETLGAWPNSISGPAVNELTDRIAVALTTERARVSELQDEVERLKQGRFTPVEFQNLCHNLPEADREAFFKGCEDYQKKLFNTTAVSELREALREWATLWHDLHHRFGSTFDKCNAARCIRARALTEEK